MAQRVWFQKWRIFWFGIRMVSQGLRVKDTNKELAMAYSGLANLSKVALIAVQQGRQEHFLQTLDLLDQMVDGDSFEEMLAGTSRDIPEWLRKNKR